MRVVVVGAFGQLGSELIESLESRGCPVDPFGRTDLDVTNAASVEQMVRRLRPQIVINAAAYTDVDAAESDKESVSRVNARGAEVLAMTLARQPTGQLIQTSTDYVFGQRLAGERPWKEDDPVSPLSEYGRSKADAERVVRKLLPDRSVVVRTAWLYAPRYPNFVTTMLTRAHRSEASRVVNDQWGQPSWARDVADITIRAAVGLVTGHTPPGIYHATNAGKATWFELARRIYAFAGADPNLVSPVSSREFPQVAQRPSWSVLGHDGWRKAGIVPLRPWEDALNEALPLFHADLTG